MALEKRLFRAGSGGFTVSSKAIRSHRTSKENVVEVNVTEQLGKALLLL